MKKIEVVAAVIRRGNEIFATQRGYGEFKDWWEFPGGKMEPGESPEQALEREIMEELDARIKVGDLLKTLHCYWCTLASESLHLNEHEASAWLDRGHLGDVKWLPADLDIIELIRNTL